MSCVLWVGGVGGGRVVLVLLYMHNAWRCPYVCELKPGPSALPSYTHRPTTHPTPPTPPFLHPHPHPHKPKQQTAPASPAPAAP